MRGLAWATVGDMEPKLHRLEQSIENSLPGKLQKIEACLGPAHQRVEELENLYQDQVGMFVSCSQGHSAQWCTGTANKLPGLLCCLLHMVSLHALSKQALIPSVNMLVAPDVCSRNACSQVHSTAILTKRH